MEENLGDLRHARDVLHAEVAKRVDDPGILESSYKPSTIRSICDAIEYELSVGFDRINTAVEEEPAEDLFVKGFTGASHMGFTHA